MPQKSANENKLFYKGDFRSEEKRTSLLGIMGKAAAVGIGVAYMNRGLRGAGWYPGVKNYWRPLATIQKSNATRYMKRAGLGRSLSQHAFDSQVMDEVAGGFGLRTIREGITGLFTRSIYGIPDTLRYLGAPKSITKAAQAIPRWVLGGTLPPAGFSRASRGLQERLVGKAFMDGSTIHRSGVKRWMSVRGEIKRRMKPGGKYYKPHDYKSRVTRGDIPFTKRVFSGQEVMKRAKSRYFPGSKTSRIIPSNPAYAIGKIFSRVVAPGYAAVLGYNYLDYRARRSKALDKTPLRGGITSAATGAWVKARMGAQKVLDKTGVLSAHRYLEDLMPGYLGIAGMAVGAALNVRGTLASRKAAGKFFKPSFESKLSLFSGALTGGLVGGIAGYALNRGLSYSPEDLGKIYSGEKKLPVRRGRWWEFGRNPFEGGKIKHYKQHWYPMMESRYKEKGALYPSEDWKWQNHWLIGRLTGNKQDPYAWEKEYYEERPYPVTSGTFDDVPIIGPSLNWAFNRFIKPRKYMHTDEWMTSSGVGAQPDASERIRHVPTRASSDLGLGEIARPGMGEVVSPDSLKNVIGEQQYRLTEWFGLPGFIAQETIKGITGKESFFETARLQDSSRATGFERNYWDREVGGLAGTTEIFRRFFPHRRRQVEEYNPIENAMGKRHSWLPGPEYFIDFKHGDPYIKVQLGEARLPGTGYEALHEMHSNIPGVYDAMDRFLILGDIAPYSEQYKHYSAIVRMWSRSGALDERWTGKKEEALIQRQSRMKKYEFTPRRFSKIRQQVTEALTSDNESKKQEPQYNPLEMAIGSAWEAASHTVANTPIPGVSWMASKMLPARTAIEHYERFQTFGRESAFWSHPVRDFAKVYAQEIAGKVAPDIIPSDVKRRWDVEEYFDRLKYVKYSQLESLASSQGDTELEKAFSSKRESTMFGLSPMGSWGSIFRAMPARERDYFEDFKSATGEDRDRIRKLISPDMKRVYEAQWGLQDYRSGVESDAESISPHKEEELSNFFGERYLPGPNWIGWHPDVDLDKVKLKVVKNEAMDIHDFNLWESQEREMEREPIPFIDNFNAPNPQYDTPKLRKDLLETMLNRGMKNPSIEFTTQPSHESSVNMTFDIDNDSSDRYYQSMGKRAYMMS